MVSPKANLPYEESYLGQLRQVVGHRKLIAVVARAVILNAQRQVLLVRRSDNGRWVMPAGSMELDENIEEALVREVWEETGLTATAWTLIAVYTDPRYSAVTAYGDAYQFVSFVFRVDAWQGDLATQTDETTDAAFFDPDHLPDDVPDLYHETLRDLVAHTGDVILK
ncbi:MAG: NUDIX domain-containing protein [Chloroflexi bacterium]|nr:NUDIX domain-containing protein [Chloroflexota bacterium]